MLEKLAPLFSRPSLRGYEARQGLEAFARTAAASFGVSITVEWGGVPTAAMTPGARMILADIPDDARVNRATVSRYAGYILHECLHRLWTNWQVVRQCENQCDPMLSALHNAIEDAWIERRAIAEGLVGNARGLLETLVETMTAEAVAEVSDWADPKQYPFSLAVFCRRYPAKVPTPANVLPIWEEAARRVDTATSSGDCLRIAEWVRAQLARLPKGQQGGQKAGQKAGQRGAQQGPEGAQQGQQQGQKAGQQGGQQGQQQAEKAGDQGQQQGGQPITAGHGCAPDPVEVPRSPEPTTGGNPNGKSYNPSAIVRRGAMPVRGSGQFTVEPRITPRLRYEVRRLFENTAREWLDPGFRSGRLHSGALHRVSLTDQVFARRMAEDGVDSAVCIVLDESGSMSGVKGRTATASVAALLACLDEARAASLVLAFGGDVHTLKPWSRNTRDARRILSTCGGMMGDTNDYEAVRFGTECLLAHPAPRKVMLVLTDGDGHVQRCKAQVASARALGVQVIGIGIEHNVERVYGPTSVRINDVADLGNIAFGRLKAAA